MIEALRARARELLATERAGVVIGYGERADGRPVPIFVTAPEGVERLIFTPACVDNLARYLTRKELKPLGRPALVATPATIKAVSVLVQENQLAADAAELIGVCVEGQGDGATCALLAGQTLAELEGEVAGRLRGKELDEAALARVVALEQQGAAERWAFWQGEFARCIRCYACRQACPLCYCEQCIVEKNQPQWVPSSPQPLGNTLFHLYRAFHLAGRCVLCDSCAEACPMDIPLDLLNRKLAREVQQRFEHEAGFDHTAPPAMASYKGSDPQEFIL